MGLTIFYYMNSMYLSVGSGSKVAFASFEFLNPQNTEKSKEESELPISLLFEKYGLPKKKKRKEKRILAAHRFLPNLYF